MIVILEDNEDRQTIMRECLSSLTPKIPIHFCKTAAETIDCLKARLHETVLIALDHDLEMIAGEHEHQMIDPGTGRDVADYLATKTPVCPVIIHTNNTPAGVGMEMTLKAASWQTQRIVPYESALTILNSALRLASWLGPKPGRFRCVVLSTRRGVFLPLRRA